ncbi:epigen [Oreochromis aureus]|uniref:EGF-like domain-containing protein n=1 Tax=Oreochromis aureus TaxID=47969 RepID=A0A668TCI8_OREAU|nr:epigen [Oreochromis aureus]CAI5649670.1 unnamed protein product [Mustela putorius furo]
MVTQRQTYLEKPFLPAVTVLLLLAAAGHSAVVNDNLQTKATPLSNSSLTTQFSNSGMELPQVLPLHKPCRSEHASYCVNGGKCMYPQDSDKPSCICAPSYSGPRCMLAEPTRGVTMLDVEQVIGIVLGVFILIIFLGIAFYLFVYKRCTESTVPIKYVPAKTSV